MLTVLLLGRPELRLDGHPLRVTRRKSRALIYLLGAHPRPLSRDQAIGWLWPDLGRPAAQQTLRTTLHALRKTLGPALMAQDDSLALAPDVDVDVRLFESALARSDSSHQPSASTLSLYRGDFLDGFTLPDAPAFDDWVSAERERYRRLAIRGLTALSRLHEEAGDLSSAQDALDRALALDAFQEDLQRSALRLHYLSGDRAGAIRRYEALRKLLDEEMGVPPMAETRALYDAIITDTLEAGGQRSSQTRVAGTRLPEARGPFVPTPGPLPQASNLQPPSPSLLPFSGRDAELRSLLDLASRGTQGLVLVEGEAGIGKTRLAQEFLRAAGTSEAARHEGGPLVTASVAHELEQAIPYQPVVDALRGLLARPDWPAMCGGLDLPPVWRAEVARLVPELGASLAESPPTFGAPDESRLWEGLRQFLLALSRQRPVILFMDDLHWADASTLALLGYLLRQSRMARTFILAAARPAELRSPLTTLLQTLTREGRLVRIELARLTLDDTAALARHLSPNFAHPLAHWLASSSEGNPYILSELVRHARDNGLLLADGMLNLAALSSTPIVPRTVYSLIQSRLSRLSEPARRVLDAAVAVGREFEFDVVARAAALSEPAALDALDELRAAGLVHPVSPDGLRHAFDHTLTMEVAYREVGELRHRRLHRRVAEAMEGLYRSRLDSAAGLIAWHFAEGHAPQRAAPYAHRAGQLAERVAAWAEAIRFYEQALTGMDETERGPILMALGGVLQRAGEFARSSEAYRSALTLAQSRGDAAGTDAARLATGQSLLVQSRFAEVVELAGAVLASGRPASAPAAEFMWGAALSLEGADLPGAIAHLQRAAEFASQEEDDVLLAQAQFELGNVVAQQGDLPQAVSLYREALDVARQAEDSDGALTWQVLLENNLGYHLHLAGDPRALGHARAGLELARQNGMLITLPYLLSTLGEIAMAQDDLPAAEAYFAEGLAIAERLNAPERIAGLTANLGRLARRRGETAIAIHRLSTALARADALGVKHLAAQIRLWLVPLLPPGEARTRLAEARAIAASGNRRRLLDEVTRLEERADW